jgi:hypothetical protein
MAATLIFSGCVKDNFSKPSAVINFPSIKTNLISNITQTTAVSGGNTIYPGEGVIKAKGVCWDTKYNPTQYSSPHTDEGGGTASFTSFLTGLSPNTVYYYRAYAESDKGTGFGDQLTFRTN